MLAELQDLQDNQTFI